MNRYDIALGRPEKEHQKKIAEAEKRKAQAKIAKARMKPKVKKEMPTEEVRRRLRASMKYNTDYFKKRKMTSKEKELFYNYRKGFLKLIKQNKEAHPELWQDWDYNFLY